MTLTPAEHRTIAEKALDALKGTGGPGSMSYHGYALAAIGHVLAAIAGYLEPPPEPDIPGLPLGWRVTVRQGENGNRMWRYELTAPGRAPVVSRYQYKTNVTALAAGLGDPSIPQEDEPAEPPVHGVSCPCTPSDCPANQL